MAHIWHNNFFDLWHPGVLAVVLLVLAAYLRGTERATRRGQHWPATPLLQKAYFVAALVIFYLAMGSPLRIAAQRYLFSAHMLQYALLSMVIPPLLLLGLPEWMLDIAWGKHLWSRLLSVATNPLVAIVMFNVIFAALEYPPILDASLHYVWPYILQSYLVVLLAVCMWWPVLSPVAYKIAWGPDREMPVERHMISRIYQLMYIFFNFALMMLLWFYIIDTHVPFYLFYLHAPRITHLTPLADQQLGVVIMEAFMGLGFVVAFVASYSRYDDSHWYD